MSKEFFNIIPHKAGAGFQMTLSNGSIDVPDDRGCYVVSTGCGSGKTECCKSLIRQKHNEGILYCVDTKAELEKVYNWIIGNLTYLGLKKNDVLMLNSDTDYIEILRHYKNDPSEIMKVKVLLITHVRFWTDLINYFIVYNPVIPEPSFDGDFSKLMARGDLRKYILFDETPFFIKPFFSIDKMTLGCLSTKNASGEMVCKSIHDMYQTYSEFIKGESGDPFPKQDSKLNKLKLEVIFNMIPKLYSRWKSTKGKMDLTFSPSDLCQNKVESHIIIFEGAGDVLFTGGSKFHLIDVCNKYNCSLNFSSFPFKLKRRRAEDAPNEKDLTSFISAVTEILEKNQKMSEKSLIVVWKNYGRGNNDPNDLSFLDLVKERLGRKRKLDKNLYDIIYYGSALGKSTNEFKDFTHIILCGTWHIVNSETAKFNEHFGTVIKNESHIQWYYTQLLSRIGVRKHDGKTYHIHYSEDYNASFIEKLKDVFSNKPASGLVPDPSICPEWLSEKFDLLKIRNNHRSEIALLVSMDEKIRDAIKTDTSLTIDVPLRELFKIIPRSRRKKDQYKRLKGALAALGVIFNITT